jgi:Histidine kinase-, DNA gyrase B-, and HSP90-like ATPase
MQVNRYNMPKPEWILELLARDVKPDQWLRELVENGKGAGATRIVIDPFVDANDRRLIRVSDNGHGMPPNQLVSRLKDLGDPKHTKNFGIGGRISTLAFNSAVYWASRAEGHSDGMVVGRPNGLELFKQENDQLLSVVDPDEGMLKWIKASGTAVILDGDGRSNTWEDNHAHKYAKQLASCKSTIGRVTRFSGACLHIGSF